MNDIQKQILTAIINIQKRNNQKFINNSQLADELGLNSQIVQDHLVLMAKEDYVTYQANFEGCLVSPTPKGRIMQGGEIKPNRETIINGVKELEIKVLQTKLDGLLKDLIIQTKNLNDLKNEAAKYGTIGIPLREKRASEELEEEIARLQSEISEIKKQLAMLGVSL